MNPRLYRLGDLEPLAEWIDSVREEAAGVFTQPTLVLFCGDHGIAEQDVSAYSAGDCAQRLRSIIAGSEAVSRLAEPRGVRIMPVDVSLDHSVDPLGATSSAAFAPSAAINTADALTAAQVTQAMELGAKVADTNIEAGTDLFLLGDLGRGSTAVAATVISIIIDVEPLKCVGRGSGIEDEAWMRKMSAVRDARRRAVPHRRDSHELLRICGGADFAAAVGFLLRACERRIPVILDGVVGAAVALLTHQLNPEAHRSWQVARNSDEPAQKIAINALGLRPILELTLPFGEGIGALLALAVLQGAATLAEADRN